MTFRGIPRATAHTYKTISPSSVLPVSLCDAKDYLKVSGSEENALISQLIATATAFGERMTKRDFINKGYTTYRDGRDFDLLRAFEIRRSPLVSVERFEYVREGLLVPVDSALYYYTKETDYSRIVLNAGEDWPRDADDRLQGIEIDFTTGMAAESDDIPADIRTAILAHVAAMYENRGDCLDCSGGVEKAIRSTLPTQSAAIYLSYKIHEIRVGYP